MHEKSKSHSYSCQSLLLCTIVLYDNNTSKVLSGDGAQPAGGYNGEQPGGYTNEYGGDNSTEWEDQHTSYYQQDNNQTPPPYNRGILLLFNFLDISGYFACAIK